MYRYYSEIDASVLAGIQEYENQQLSKFRREFDRLCLSISRLHGWNYTAGVHRWIDTADTWRGRQLDGYTATLQVDFTGPDGNLIEIDENVCSFFENITFISFDPILRKYRVFQNEVLGEIQREIDGFVQGIMKNKGQAGD